MTWNDYSRKEKIAIIKTAIHAACCDYKGSSIKGFVNSFTTNKHSINYSQELYLKMLLTRMNADKSYLTEMKTMSSKDMTKIVKQMDSEKRKAVFLIWMSILCRCSGSAYYAASISLTDFSNEYESTVRLMARDMNIDIIDNFTMSEYGYL